MRVVAMVIGWLLAIALSSVPGTSLTGASAAAVGHARTIPPDSVTWLRVNRHWYAPDPTRVRVSRTGHGRTRVTLTRGRRLAVRSTSALSGRNGERVWTVRIRGAAGRGAVRMRVVDLPTGQVLGTVRRTVGPRRQRTFRVRTWAASGRAQSLRVSWPRARSGAWLRLSRPRSVLHPSQGPAVPRSSKGVPMIGAYLGMAYGGNEDPTHLERTLGAANQVRRTYFLAHELQAARKVARRDLAAGRLPWVSFKPPLGWDQMAAGAGDAWARRVHATFASLKGPVWVAVHHEPEGDGDIAVWRAMQERIAPLIRGDDSSNIAWTVILTGWRQLHGPAGYSLAEVWPRHTRVDVAGFDVYNSLGVFRKGVVTTTPTDMVGGYFNAFQAWSQQTGVPWALSETGYTDYAHQRDPLWIARTRAEVAARGGVAMTYFNSTLNSVANWRLSGARQDAFATALRDERPTP